MVMGPPPDDTFEPSATAVTAGLDAVYLVEKQILDRLDTMIKVTLDLIAHRMGWLLISQSFLFTAFALALGNAAGGAGADAAARNWSALLARLILVLPAIGIGTALIVGVSVAAAIAAIQIFKKRRSRLQQSLQRRAEAYGVDANADFNASSLPYQSWEDRFGYLPSVLLPPGLLAAWTFVAVRLWL